jgi:hypothetical protein
MTTFKICLFVCTAAFLGACAQQEEPAPMMEPMEVQPEPSMSKM